MNKLLIAVSVFLTVSGIWGLNSKKISPASAECIDCHIQATPSIVKNWERSSHAGTINDEHVVSCAECHTIDPEKHRDTFDHNGSRIHTVVSPPDCGTCHPEEAQQYSRNLMSHAYGNLMHNSLYRHLIRSVTGEENDIEDSCLHCHGSMIQPKGIHQRETVFGEMEFPVLEGWPNQGTGRINPDNSRGSCTPCHTRHDFSIETARKPHTCSQCHKGPDVPAYRVYTASKHGNLYASNHESWEFGNSTWVAGEDFTAPTCATCHISRVATPEGEILSRRTHQMNDRLPHRLFGLIYSHPHPANPDTSIIRNNGGLPLPTELSGEPVRSFLISPDEQEKRLSLMKGVCSGCHSGSVIDSHFKRLEQTVARSDQLVKTATGLIGKIWEKGIAGGPGRGDSPFNEGAEKIWTRCWLFYGNTIRLASAMMGADYSSFANGHFQLSEGIRQLREVLEKSPNGKFEK